MAKIKANFDYDQEVDSLYIYVPAKSPSESVASISAGDYFILDIIIGKNDALKFKGFEILDASKWMDKSMSIDSDIKVTPKQILRNIKSIYVETKVSNDCIFILSFINAVVKNEKVEATQALPIPIRC